MKSSEDPSPTMRRSARSRRARRLTVTLVTTATILGLGGYTAAAATAEIPAPQLKPAPEAERTIASDPSAAQAAVDAQALPTAIGWADGDEVWANDGTAHPIGSITKLIMVLVCMDRNPLDPGADGDTYIWTAEDRARTQAYLDVGGVAYDIPVGTEITQREMLELIFIPSANDSAYAYATWTFGSNEAFLVAFEDWKQKHGLDSITLVEPTGLDTDDRAAAADLVRVARLALQNPTITEFNGMQSADLPWGIGTVETSNPLLGVMPGIIGMKTGTIFSSYNFVVSQRVDLDGREAVNIAVTLQRPSKPARAESGREMLDLMATLPQQVEVLAEGEVVGTAITAHGERIPLVTTAAASALLLPGEEAALQADFTGKAEGAAGDEVGAVRITTPGGEQEVPVVTTEAVGEPDLWWRLTNPGVLFG